MGGKEGTRGYLYQAFAAILEALNEEYWNNIIVELNTTSDKVDIALELDNKLIKTIQVKSSINLFTKSEILKWLEDLIDDTQSSEYALHLIGSCDAGANKLIKSIEKVSQDISDKETKESLKNVSNKILKNKISIKQIPFDIQVLEGIVRDSLNKYIYSKGLMVDYEGLDLIAKAISLVFMLISTDNKPMSKEAFDRKIYQWLNTTLGSYIKSTKLFSMHELLVYDKYNDILSQDITEIKLENYYGVKYNRDKNVERLKELINKIKSINLDTHEVVSNIDKNLDFYVDKNIQNTIEIMNKVISNFGDKTVSEKYLEIDDKLKDTYIKHILRWTGETLEKHNFYVGNLKEVKRESILNGAYDEIIGSRQEKDKYRYIDEVESILFKLELTDTLINEMGKCSVFPLVVKNTSNISDKNIKIKVKVPKNVKLRLDGNLTSKMNSLADIYCSNDEIIENIFKIEADSKVYKDSNRQVKEIYFPKLSTLDAFGMSKYSVEDINSKLRGYIEQNVYYDDKQFNVLEFEISELFSNEIKALENIILIESLDNGIKLEYEVRSENSDGTINGIININKHKEQ